MTSHIKTSKSFLPVFGHVFKKGRSVPGQLVIQMTNRCNGHCPQCGMRATESFKRSTLSVDTIKRIIDHAAFSGVSAVSFTGGEPLLYFNELLDLIHHAGKRGIGYIRTGTNGFVFQNHESPDFTNRIDTMAKRLADTPVRNFWISIDSAFPEIHERMRGFSGLIEGIRKALPIFHQNGIYPSANLGINRNIGGDFPAVFNAPFSHNRRDYLARLESHFQNAFHTFFQFVIDMGFTIVNACYPMSIKADEPHSHLSAVYSATSTDRIVNFASDEKAVIYKALSEVIPAYRSQVRIFSPLCSLYTLINQHQGHHEHITGCRGGIDFFFIDAKDGNTYPCGYRGDECLGKYWEMKQNGCHHHTHCTRCDWECFRDPSDLFGPLLDFFSNPLAAVKTFFKKPEFYRLWTSDLAYYYKCNFFDGRKPLS